MSYLNNRYKKSNQGYQFKQENGKNVIPQLSIALSKGDFHLVVSMVETAYSAGVLQGEKNKINEIRECLALDNQ